VLQQDGIETSRKYHVVWKELERIGSMDLGWGLQNGMLGYLYQRRGFLFSDIADLSWLFYV